MNPGFWHNKRVLVTGHTGFKGSWLSLWLQQWGAHVTGYALDPPSDPSLFVCGRVADGMSSIHGDVRDLPALVRVMQAARPEIVLHLAAQSLVRPSYTAPVETYATNVMGTVHVLEAVRQVPGVRSVVVVTSDKCYANREWVWGYREDEAMGGHDPYSNSKGCAELVTSAYRASYWSAADSTVRVASGRAGNVIGGGDWAQDRLVPDLLAALTRQEVPVLRNPHAIRPWQHVLEPLSGYLTLAERLYAGEAWAADGWNFGPSQDDVQPVSGVADRLVALWGEGARWQTTAAPQPHEASLLMLDSAKARYRLGWRPRWSLPEALAQTVAWQRAWVAGADMRAFTLGQIDSYLQPRA